MKIAFVAPPVPAVPLSRLQREYYFYLFASRVFSVFDHLDKADFDRFWMLEPVNLGLLQLIAFLEQHGFECSYFGPISPGGRDTDREALLLDKLLARVDEFDVVGFTSITASYPTAARMAAVVRRVRPDLPLLLGGNHAWIRPREVLQGSVFDILVHKEGEDTTLELLRAMQAQAPLDQIAGLSFRHGDTIVTTPNRPRMDRRCLPGIGYDHLEDNFTREDLDGGDRILIPISRVAPMTGCRNNCVWCADYWKPQITEQNSDRFAEELDYLRAHRGTRFFYVGTHDFFHDLDRALRIGERMGELSATSPLHWEAQTRVSTEVTPEHLQTLRRQGCRCLHVGIESGDQTLLDAMKKNIRLEDAVRMLTMAREADIATHTYWLIGSPFETYDTAKKTMATMRDWMASDLSSTGEVNMLVAYPGTAYYEHGSRYGITWNDPDYAKYDGRNVPTYETKHLTRRDMDYLFHRALDIYCEVLSDKLGGGEAVMQRLADRFPNFDPAFMEAAF